MGNKRKERMFRIIVDFKDHPRFNKDYVMGRLIQMAKMICAPDGESECVTHIRKWKVKQGILVQNLVAIRTTEEKFFKFLDIAEQTYPGLIKEFTVSKKRK